MITISSFNFTAILPMIIVAMGAVTMPFTNRLGKYSLYLASTVLFIAIYVLNFEHNVIGIFNGQLLANNFNQYVQLILLITGIVTCIMSASYSERRAIFTQGEFASLMLFAILGMMLMVSANDYLILYLGLELQSLCLYLLAAYDRDNLRSTEAGLKYFTLGAVASAILLYGISLIYGYSGTINFTEFGFYIASSSQIAPALLLGMMLVIVAISFKIAAAPFHIWAPDVYQGAAINVTAFFALLPKIAAMAVFIQLFNLYRAIWADSWQQIVMILSALSMIIGSLAALMQKDFKRLLAYSSIAHVGFMLIGVATQTISGLQATLLYLNIYIVVSVGIFTLLILVYDEDCQIDNLSGLSEKHPLVAASFTMLLLSFAGMPPFAGFIAKFSIIMSALQAGLYSLAMFAMIISIISAYFYLRIIKIMYFNNISSSNNKIFFYNSWSGKLVLIVSIVLNIVLFMIPSAFNNKIYSYLLTLWSN